MRFLEFVERFECSVDVSDGFPKKIWMEWVGRVSSVHFIFRIFFNFAKPLNYC